MILSIPAILRRQLQFIRQIPRNWYAVRQGAKSGRIFFQHELQQFLDCSREWLVETAAEYRACPAAWKYLSCLQSASRRTDGLGKSLDVAEGFAVWALVKHVRPQVVVELGVQYGISARLWKEALKKYVPEHELILCDLEDKRYFITDDDCTFLKGDARESLPKVFASRSVELLHNDAHPYDLIDWSVTEAIKHGVPVLTFHDVGGKHSRGPFKVESSQLSKAEKLNDSENWEQFGAWERHIMAEVFDNRVLYEDAVENNLYRVQIFDSLLGFGVVFSDFG